jgi:hypothetical protein
VAHAREPCPAQCNACSAASTALGVVVRGCAA